MFPYTVPASIHEVNRFMASVGAGTHTTAPARNWGAAVTPSSTHYYCRNRMSAGLVLKWTEGRGEEFDTTRRVISADVLRYLVKHFQLLNHASEFSVTAMALNQIGQELSRAGLPRTLATESLMLFSEAYGCQLDLELNGQDSKYVRGIINCARLLNDPSLTADERLDQAVSGVDPAIVTEMTAKGIPLNLIRELYGTW